VQVLIGFIGGINAPLYFAMIGDTADYAEWKFKVRTTGIIFSSSSFMQKIGLGIGGALSGYLLSYYGYVAGAVQTAASSHGILLMVSLIPGVGSVLVGLVFLVYPLDEAFCHRIREDLALRRLE
jgi:GPH family glycoside/pentoside/hexuronide:cation symporter